MQKSASKDTVTRIVVIKSNGEFEITPITKLPDHTQLHDLVGGYIEIVPFFNRYNGEPCIAFCDEDGKRHGKPFNQMANTAWELAVGQRITNDYLVGDIAIVIGPVSWLRKM